MQASKAEITGGLAIIATQAFCTRMSDGVTVIPGVRYN